MNRLLKMSLVSLSLLALNGCNSSDSNSSQTTTAPTVDNTPATAHVTTAKCEANGSSISSFQRIPMHYGFLRDTTFVSGESGGTLPLTVTADAEQWARTIDVDSTTALVVGQLITYLGENFDYNVAKIESLTATTITLTESTALVSKVAAGNNAWNFYDHEYTPNHYGQKALADLSYRESAAIVNAGATHVIIGDGWINDEAFTARLEKRYPSANIINNASDADGLCDLLAGFGTDVSAKGAQYVWINSSVSDYTAGVSQEDYKLRLQDLIAKVQSAGATAIVFDAVAGSANVSADGVVTNQTLSYRYSSKVADLISESNTAVTEPVTETETPQEPVTETETEQEPVIETETETEQEPVTETETEEEPVVVVTPPTETEEETTAESIDTFTRVEMHFGLLKGQGYVSDVAGQSETGGLETYTVNSAATAGATLINVASTSGLVTGQLITYLASDSVYRVAQVESLTDTQITLTAASAIVSGLNTGETLWNFYEDPDHPNTVGANAIADFAHTFVSGDTNASTGTHVLLGDSWFTNNGFDSYVMDNLPNATIINESTGGNTLSDLLTTFDSNVVASGADFVWINSSTNDYFNDVSQEDYKERMQSLIAKVQSIGATAVVFDSTPAPVGITDSGVTYETLANRYSDQIRILLNEANGQ
jgi:lysophospholipase L1-like esterase